MRSESKKVLPTLEKAVAMPDYKQSNETLRYRVESADDEHPVSEMGLPQWFALAVKPRFDKAVARTLDAKGFETFLPLYKKKHSYGARCKEFELPLFPGYVFCRFSTLARLPILTTPGVTHILGTGNRPVPLSETEIASLQTAIKAQLPLQPFPFLQVGQRVQIEEGVLAGVVGIIVRVKQSVNLVLSVTLLQRSVLLEINRDQVAVEQNLQSVSGEARPDSASSG
jgi:transcription antitermination factor NusG